MIKNIAVLALLGLISKEQVFAQDAGETPAETPAATPAATCDTAMKCAEDAVQAIITASEPTVSVTLTNGIDCDTVQTTAECELAATSLVADTAEEEAIDTVETAIEEAEAVTEPAEEAVAVEEAIAEAEAEVETLAEVAEELEEAGDVDAAEEVVAGVEEIEELVEEALAVEEAILEENPTNEEVIAAVAEAEAEVETLEELVVVIEEELAAAEETLPDPAAAAEVANGNAAVVQPSAEEPGAEVSATTQGNQAAQGNGGGAAVVNTNTTVPATPAAEPAAEPAATPAATPAAEPAAQPNTTANSNSNSARAMAANSLYLQAAASESGVVYDVEGNVGLEDGTAADLALKIGAGAEASVVPFIVAEANADSSCFVWKQVSSQLAVQEITWGALHDGDHDGDAAKQAADVACKDAIRVYNQWIATNVWGHCVDGAFPTDWAFPADGYATATAAYYLAAETATVAQLDTLIPEGAAEDDVYAAYKAVLVGEEEVLTQQLNDVTPAAAGGSGGTIAVAVVALLAVGGLGYYCFTKKDEGADGKENEGGIYETLL